MTSVASVGDVSLDDDEGQSPGAARSALPPRPPGRAWISAVAAAIGLYR